jgi:DNA-binding SARP family transcriptional activator
VDLGASASVHPRIGAFSRSRVFAFPRSRVPTFPRSRVLHCCIAAFLHSLFPPANLVAVPASPRLRIELLGGFRLFVDGRLSARQPGARQQQLIAFLVLHAREAPIPRQRAGGSLWPDSTDAQALTNLRRELNHLRDEGPALEALIDAGSRTIAWRRGAAPLVDLVSFENAAERGLTGDLAALKEAAQRYQGDLLPDVHAEWIDSDRERLRQRATKVLAQLVAALGQSHAWDEAIGHAQALLRLDPLEEDAWRMLMRSQARRGDRAAALQTYQQCAAVLKKELGVGPSAATRLAYREIVEQDVAPPEPSPPRRTTSYPLVGRRLEWQALLGAWRSASASGGRVGLVAIRGEAGIGKTRLAEELVAWCGVNGIAAIDTRCYAGEGRLAYAPIASWLKSDALHPALMKLDPAWLSDVARLHPGLLAARPEVAAPGRQLESWQRLRFFEALAQAFRSSAPLVLVVDDLQWADGDTIEWIHYFLRSAAGAPCLVVGTIRAEEQQDNRPLVRLLTQLQRDSLLTTIALGPLDRTATAQLAGEVLEHQLDEATLARTFRETEGHPLFIIERGRMQLAETPGAAAAEALPQVQSVVAARLALLSSHARAVADIAAAIGRDFRVDILTQVSDLAEDALVTALDELWHRHIVRMQDSERWDFTHDRIRETAYSEIGPARRQLIHRRIAQAMEQLAGDRVDEASASIAMHLERAGQAAQAVPYLERAAAEAARVSANEEAIRLLNHALALLAGLPESRDRDMRELTLREQLSIALNSGRGYAAADVEDNLDRVFALSTAGGSGDVPVRWLWAAFTLRFMLGDLQATRAVSEQALARSRTDPSCRCEAHHAMGGLLLSLGELEASKEHFEASLAAYDEAHPQRSALGSDLGVFAHAWYSHTLFLLGEEDAALAHVDQAIVLATRQNHVYSQVLARAYAALLHQLRGDVARVLSDATEVVRLCGQYEFAYYGDWAQALIGWTRGIEQPEEGVVIIEAALEQLDRNRAQARRPYYLSLLADTCSRFGDRERATSILDTAITIAETGGDKWWLPALYVQRGEFQLPAAREALRLRALELARRQHSRTLERQIVDGTLSRTLRERQPS